MQTLNNKSGQALLIGVLLLVTLILAIPSIVFMNQSITQHATQSQLKLKGRAVSEEGLAYAMQRLTQADGWPFPGGNGNLGLPPNEIVTSAQSQKYALTFTSAPNTGLTELYHVGVLSRALDSKDNPVPGSSVFAQISRRTTGAQLPRGFSISAALELMNAPQFMPNAGLHVYFGPIVIHSSEAVRLDAVSDSTKRPRKFAEGPIMGSLGSQNTRAPDMNAFPTDQKEYWAYNSLGFASIINLSPGNIYEQYAKDSVCLMIPTAIAGNPGTSGNNPGNNNTGGVIPSSGTGNPYYGGVPPTYFPGTGNPGNNNPGAGNPGQGNQGNNMPVGNAGGGHQGYGGNNPVNPNPGNSPGTITQTGCYFDVPPGTVAVFDGDNIPNPLPAPAQGYVVNPAVPTSTPTVVYVNGDAEFRRVTMNVGNQGAIIVKGNLTLADNRDPSGGFNIPTSCPASRCLDLPYDNCGQVPCRSTHYRDLTGFVYVTNNLLVRTNTNPGWWSMDGTLRIDGLLTVWNNSNLELYYNDAGNRNIKTANFDIQIDSITAIQ